MVLLNYEKVIEEKLLEQADKMQDPQLAQVCRDPDFTIFMVKLYEYCEEINIIEMRMDILAKQTEKMQPLTSILSKCLKPKLLDSEIIKIQQKTKQISSCYSVFLFKQPRFKVPSDESAFYEGIIRLVTTVLEKCFSKEDFFRLRKGISYDIAEINRLMRTNTFNKRICWEQFVTRTKKDPSISKRKKKMVQTDFRGFRRSVTHQKSEIRPYVNNRSSFRTKLTRSPMVSLLFPTNEYMSFKLARQNLKSFTMQP